MLQWYWYVPVTVSVTVKVLFGLMFPESKDAAPLGTDPEVTVCCVESWLVQTMVLFTPTLTLIVEGVKLRAVLLATPDGIDVATVVFADER